MNIILWFLIEDYSVLIRRAELQQTEIWKQQRNSEAGAAVRVWRTCGRKHCWKYEALKWQHWGHVEDSQVSESDTAVLYECVHDLRADNDTSLYDLLQVSPGDCVKILIFLSVQHEIKLTLPKNTHYNTHIKTTRNWSLCFASQCFTSFCLVINYWSALCK